MPTQQLLPDNLLWLECILKIIMAIAIGFALGVERQLRLKVAGIRTHVIVAAGACLFMIVSKYGFEDPTKFDASRIASQVVTGIGFLGAGMILHRQNAVHGLTSAAGIWLTAAIAMATGAGMYFVSLGATVLIIIIQLLLHLPLNLFKEKRYNEIKVVFKSPTEDCPSIIKTLFGITNFSEFKAERKGGEIVYYALITTKLPITAAFIYKTVNENPFILSIEKMESDR